MKSFAVHLPKVAVILAVLTLIVVVGDAIFLLDNQKVEADVQRRQQFINQSLQLNPVGNALIQALGAAAINNNDTAIRDVLSEYGITATANAPTASGTPKAP